jgi:A/G-specific adenine glycosylase
MLKRTVRFGRSVITFVPASTAQSWLPQNRASPEYTRHSTCLSATSSLHGLAAVSVSCMYSTGFDFTGKDLCAAPAVTDRSATAHVLVPLVAAIDAGDAVLVAVVTEIDDESLGAADVEADPVEAGPEADPIEVGVELVPAELGVVVVAVFWAAARLPPPEISAPSVTMTSTTGIASRNRRRRQYMCGGRFPTGCSIGSDASRVRTDVRVAIPWPIVNIAEVVSRWYGDHARDLPWRRAGTTPWAVLVSEVMLQQTPVARVIPAWTAWLARWPGPGDLAAATSGDAVRMWGKLGYPRRALRLRDCATVLTRDHGGRVPDDIDALLALPGIGVYTARAVATFAFGQRHPVVDINVRRVIARVVHGRGEPGPPSVRRDLADVDALLPEPPSQAARASVALMELGAVVCTAARPRCDACPLTARCRWRRDGYPVYDGPTVRPQKFAGTDRQVRGRLLDVLRGAPGPVTATVLDLAWAEPVQRDRALASLIRDGLIDPLDDGRFALPER